jgi:prepilin peptidase CpaA
MAFVTGMGWSEFLFHLGAGVTLFVLSTALFIGGIWGGGDAKLLPAVALWVGLAGQPRFLLVMAFVGGVMALGALLARHLPLKRQSGIQTWGVNFVDSGQVPYGLAIAAAGLDWWAVTMVPQLSWGA